MNLHNKTIQISLLFIMFILFTITLKSQNLVKAYKYINQSEYEKATKILAKAYSKKKEPVAVKFAYALIFTKDNYPQKNLQKAYFHIQWANENYKYLSSAKRQQYAVDFRFNQKTIDSLTNHILFTEYTKAFNTQSYTAFDVFIKNYPNNFYSKKLSDYSDSSRYEDVKKDGSMYSFWKYYTDYPESKFRTEAKANYEKLWVKSYESAFRSLDYHAISDFKNRYPDYPYYNDSTQIYITLAKESWDLKLYLGYMISTNDYYGTFIKKAAPREIAYQALLVLVQPVIEKKEFNNAIDTIKKYKPYFGKSPKIDKTISLLQQKEPKIEIKNIGANINTNGNEYMPVLTVDNKTLYFCGEDRQDNFGLEDIFISLNKEGKWSKSGLLRDLSTASKNEAALCVSPDGTTLYIFINGDIYFTEKTKTGWTQHLPIKEINTTTYWEADAFMTADGNAIFFATDRYGNIGDYKPFSRHFHGDLTGNLDIYVVVKEENGWSEPINLGITINTPYAERTPFFHPDMKTLYFSSDGHAGLGKLDVFKSERLNDTSWTDWSEPINLGNQINSPKKEFGYKISTDGTKAFFNFYSENQSDIYIVELFDNIRPEYVALITGKVTNSKNEPLDANIVWEDLESGKTLGSLKTDPQTGYYSLTLPLDKNYGFFVSCKDYYPLSDNINLHNISKYIEIQKDFQLIKIQDIITGVETIELKNVFFDYDKFELKSESFPELNRLAQFIKTQPNIKIEISGHTDNKGSKEYNEILSKNRAQAVANYLVQIGCNQNQLTTKGYADQKPISDNSTEEDRKKNRRVEFQVIK